MTTYERISITATRAGMTAQQKHTFTRKLQEWKAVTLIHGDCIGGDADSHAIAKGLGMRTEAYPCTISNQRAHCNADFIAEPAAPLTRNRTIVRKGEILVGIPRLDKEEQRSGTWSTLRYGMGMRPVYIIWPDGRTTEFE